MPNARAQERFLFGGLSPGREGALCERSICALSFLFHGWAHYKGPRKDYYGHADGGVLPIIEFEKLALFWCRVWERLWRLHGLRDRRKNPLQAAEEAPRKITFSPPFIIERAKHGKRPQRYNGTGRPATIAEITYGLQDLGIRYFDIHPGTVRGAPDPNHYKTSVLPTLPAERRDLLLEGFNDVERKILNEMDTIVRQLGVLEIRALGTHESLSETIADIELEFQHLTGRAVSELTSALRNQEPCFELAQEFLEYAEEAFRKSSLARKADYDSAHTRFTNDVKDPMLAEAFRATHAKASDIWEAPQMQAIASRADRARAIGKCVTAIAYFSEHPDQSLQGRSSNAREMIHHWTEGFEGLKRHRLSMVCGNLNGAFTPGGRKISAAVSIELSTLIEVSSR